MVFLIWHRPGHDIHINQPEFFPHRDGGDATIIIQIMMLAFRPFAAFANKEAVTFREIAHVNFSWIRPFKNRFDVF